jgi:glycosyltransferase involved in cell wall biosynthesis
MHGLGGPGGGDPLACARLAPGVPVARAGIAEPCAHRSERAGHSHRRHDHRRTGLLSRTPEELADDVARLAGDPALRARLGAAAQAHAAARFDAAPVVGRIEALYADLIAERRA